VHRDTLLVPSIAYDESRLRGPILSLAWWLLYAERALPQASFIGKLDDDAYVHAPDLEQMLRLVHLQLGPTANVYLGVLTWYHWYPALFDHTMHAWSFGQAMRVGNWCRSTDLHAQGCDDAAATAMAIEAGRNLTAGPALSPSGRRPGCGRCHGPFAFAAGYLIVGSRALVRGVVAQGGIAADVARLRASDAATMRNKQGRRTEMVMEDVWLGYILHAYPLASPVRYMSLFGDKRSKLYVDVWDFRISRTAILTHVSTKQLERFLAFHHYATDASEGAHCSADVWRVHCQPHCGTRAATRHLPEWCTGHTAAEAAEAGQLPAGGGVGGVGGGAGGSAGLAGHCSWTSGAPSMACKRASRARPPIELRAALAPMHHARGSSAPIAGRNASGRRSSTCSKKPRARARRSRRSMARGGGGPLRAGASRVAPHPHSRARRSPALCAGRQRDLSVCLCLSVCLSVCAGSPT
jgi:hypothetical protein